ncbi:MAG TPA: hypothetical protein VIJ42_00420, partial [Stellaceae bacterium]
VRVACCNPTLLGIAAVAANRPACARLVAVAPAGRSAASYTTTRDTTTIIWIGNREGEIKEATYVFAEHAVSVAFQDDFANAEKVFRLPGIRRALVAYWSDRLADLRERNAKSTYADHHAYDAVAELIEYRRATENVFSPKNSS